MKKKDITQKDLRKFGAVLAIVLGLAGYLSLRRGHSAVYPWLWGAAAADLAVSLSLPGLLRPVYRIFVKIAHAIGWVNTRVILVLVFYFILTPIGLVMRLFKKDPLSKRADRDARSYWVKRDGLAASRASLEKQF